PASGANSGRQSAIQVRRKPPQRRKNVPRISVVSSALLTLPTATASVALKLNLVSEAGRHLTSEPVTDADLANLRSEAWFTAFVRRGMAGVPFSEIAFRVVPILKADSETVCAG